MGTLPRRYGTRRDHWGSGRSVFVLGRARRCLGTNADGNEARAWEAHRTREHPLHEPCESSPWPWWNNENNECRDRGAGGDVLVDSNRGDARQELSAGWYWACDAADGAGPLSTAVGLFAARARGATVRSASRGSQPSVPLGHRSGARRRPVSWGRWNLLGANARATTRVWEGDHCSGGARGGPAVDGNRRPAHQEFPEKRNGVRGTAGAAAASNATIDQSNAGARTP